MGEMEKVRVEREGMEYAGKGLSGSLNRSILHCNIFVSRSAFVINNLLMVLSFHNNC